MTKSRIIVTADDLGISEGVNAGIVESFEDGIVTTCSLLANGLAFDHAVRDTLVRSDTLPVGAHLNIMFDKPLRMTDSELVGPEGLFRGSYARILRHLSMASNKRLQASVRDEFRAQAARVAESISRPLDHFNTQSHIHAIPAVFELVYEVANEMGCPNVRICKEPPQIPFVDSRVGLLDSTRAAVLYLLSSGIRRRGPGIPARIMGMNRSGEVYADAIAAFALGSPPGLSEICVHPGYPLGAGETLYAQRWVDAWIAGDGRRLEMEALKKWRKSQFESDYAVSLQPFAGDNTSQQGTGTR